MEAIVVIPARLQSSRFPEKVLAKRTGKYLIQHVYEQASKASTIDDIIIAADSEKIANACREFGAKVCLTPQELSSGTERIAYLVSNGTVGADIIVNLQADEPMMPPENIDLLVKLLEASDDVPVATLATAFSSIEEINDPSNVKVVFDKFGFAMYFSRAIIPYPRDGFSSLPTGFRYYLHLGLYAYRQDFLLMLPKLPPSPLEQTEKLEQLRILWNGFKIKVGLTDKRSFGVDTPEDYERFVRWQMEHRDDS